MASIKMQIEEDMRVKGLDIEAYTDVSQEWGGLGRYPSPTDYLLVSLGACVLSLMGLKARAMRFDLTGTQVEVEKIMTREERFEKLIVTVDCTRAIDRKTAEKLERAAKGCPVHEVISVEQEFIFRWNFSG
jgi:putative redox protein